MNKLIAFLILCTIPIAVVAGATTSPGPGDGYQTYTNARFSYSVSYPADLLIPQGEAENGDGQMFTARDGSAEMRVYGGYNVLNETIAGKFAELTRKWGKGVTYKVVRKDWFVVSALVNGKIHYQKTLLRGDTFKTFSIEYDAARRATYDPVTTNIVKSFHG